MKTLQYRFLNSIDFSPSPATNPEQMEFGKVDSPEILERIDFTLPNEDPHTRAFLQSIALNSADARRDILIGAPAWGRKEWIGSVYPPGTKAADFLFHYAQLFDTIELNTTHYRIPTPEQAAKWISQVRSEFLFCPKVFKEISHSRTGLINKSLLYEWFEFAESLGQNLGPCFIQLPPHFTYSEKALLFQFLKSWPNEIPLSVELRHVSWFQNGVVLPALVEYLQSRGIGLVMTDVAGRRDVLHSSVTSSHVMVRLVGNELHSSDFVRLQNWIQRLRSWRDLGLSKPILFLHQPDDIKLPDFASAARELMGVADQPLHWLSPQLT